MTSKEELFERTPLPKAMAKLAIPTMIASVVMVIYNLADTFFVGMLNNPIATSAVTLASPIVLLFNAVTNLFGAGAGSKMARALGVKDYKTFKKTSAFGFWSTILSGIVFSLIMVLFNRPILNVLGADSLTFDKTYEYLFWTVVCGAVPSMLNVVLGNLFRSEGSATHASIGVMSGCILNIILDPLFILPSGLNMGAAGAGLATFISNCVACLYFFVVLYIKRNNTYVCVDIRWALPTKEIAKEVFGVGVPSSIQNILNVTGSTILNNLATAYGPEAVSAIGITHKLAMIPLYFSMGAGQGVMPLLGYNFAAKNKERFTKTIRYAEIIMIVSMTLSGIILYIVAHDLVALFMENELVIEYGTGFMRGFSLAVPFLAFDFLAVGIFQACGMGGLSLVFALCRKIVLEIPAIIELNRVFGVYGLSYGQLVAEFVLAIAAYIVIENIILNKIDDKKIKL